MASTGLIWIQNYPFEVLFEQKPILFHSSSSLNFSYFSSPLQSSSCLISLGENSNYLLTQPRIEIWCWIINGQTYIIFNFAPQTEFVMWSNVKNTPHYKDGAICHWFTWYNCATWQFCHVVKNCLACAGILLHTQSLRRLRRIWCLQTDLWKHPYLAFICCC